MRISAYIFILLLSFVRILPADYLIYRGKDIAGSYRINAIENRIEEISLFTDGFSQSYNAGIHNLGNNYNYISVKYFSRNDMPYKIEYSNKVLSKSLRSINSKININNGIDLLFNHELPVYAIKSIRKDSRYLNSISGSKMNIVKVNNNEFLVDNIKVKVYGGKVYPDSIYFGPYRFILSKNIEIINPYRIDYDKIGKEDEFNKRKFKAYKINSVNCRLYYDNEKKDTLVIIMPFDYKSDIFGNLYNKNDFLIHQLCVGMKHHVLTFSFENILLENNEKVKNYINQIYNHFKKGYKYVVFIAYNQMLPILLETGVNEKIIAINPPFISYNEYLKKLQIMGGASVYSSIDSYIKFDPFYDTLLKMNFIDEYEKHSRKLFFIFSYDIYGSDEIKNIEKISVNKAFMQSVDIGLNSYIIDKRTGRKLRTKVHQKTLDYINKIISR